VRSASRAAPPPRPGPGHGPRHGADLRTAAGGPRPASPGPWEVDLLMGTTASAIATPTLTAVDG
jgi:hypothetical protein